MPTPSASHADIERELLHIEHTINFYSALAYRIPLAHFAFVFAAIYGMSTASIDLPLWLEVLGTLWAVALQWLLSSWLGLLQKSADRHRDLRTELCLRMYGEDLMKPARRRKGEPSMWEPIRMLPHVSGILLIVAIWGGFGS